MKKILSTLIFSLILIGNSAFSKNIIPTEPILNTVYSLGVYQVGDDIKIYKEPQENSQILYRVRWNRNEFFPDEIGANKFFAIFLEKKDLAYVNVADVTEDWVEIIYDKTTGKTGFIKKDDPYKFMTWINFYNIYGKKYGLKLLKGTPDVYKDLKAAPEDNSQIVDTINVPKFIQLNVIRGNWALVSVLDLDRTPKTGYIRWRSEDGTKYYFPDLK